MPDSIQYVEQLRRELNNKLAEFGEDHSEVLKATLRLAQALHDNGMNDEAFGLAQSLLSRQCCILGTNSYEALRTLHLLASILYSQGQYESSLQLFSGLVNVLRREYPENDGAQLAALQGMAMTLRQRNNYERDYDQIHRVLHQISQLQCRVSGNDSISYFRALCDFVALEKAVGHNREMRFAARGAYAAIPKIALRLVSPSRWKRRVK